MIIIIIIIVAITMLLHYASTSSYHYENMNFASRLCQGYRLAGLGINYREMQWEGGAVDGGSIM